MSDTYRFPRTQVEGLSLPRLIVGSNWFLGWSHRSTAMDHMITRRFDTIKRFHPVFDAFAAAEIDAVMGPCHVRPILAESKDDYEQKTGRKLILIDTPIINVDDSPIARKEAEKVIRYSAKIGASLCLIHHSSAEQLVNKNSRSIERLGDYTDMIRQADMIPGLSAHMPELVTYSDEQGYDVQTYIQIYNCLGFLMQVEVETVASIIHHAKKPVITIKPLAAGRTTPYVGLNFVWNTIRDCDMVTIGCSSAEEAMEDIEISRAALERCFPVIEKRQSPNMKQDAFGINHSREKCP